MGEKDPSVHIGRKTMVAYRVRQVGSLREYQKEFERLGNRVQGWTQKALIGTFMGGLKPKIADQI
ncbi:hypothetical protein CK203_057588 [Vitis vinifera]|uniref:Retrotransposon gag domain-containing protein n=1 Tax=Vitis vinifera TaxID=29760 RepID=A0A438CBI7_VITVI|nr:hypothetical protein CK203_112956 [Vitis vinifera]RVW63399.1 hypothetical protein CK203_055929 [Vitis vinifera]RVW71437.1 hypothetical protein CK203_057588 [Vitis vinifera]